MLIDSLVRQIINGCWILFIVVWALAAIFTKRTVYRQPRVQRLAYMVPIVVGCWLLFNRSRLPRLLSARIVPHADALLLVAAILCVAGLGFCFWARTVLGRNWSGTVTLKEDHELIVRGPYRLVRHPIYTGMLGILLGTAILQGHAGGILGLLLVFASFWIKSSHEEEVMLKQFPEQYPAYRARVKRIIPFIV
jgi:protein-S-isoprenylcysteine O-methyltransferase Ste14